MLSLPRTISPDHLISPDWSMSLLWYKADTPTALRMSAFVSKADMKRTRNDVAISPKNLRSAGIRLVEIGDDDLLHLHHSLHHAAGLVAIGIAEVSPECVGDNLPRQAKFILEPSAS